MDKVQLRSCHCVQWTKSVPASSRFREILSSDPDTFRTAEGHTGVSARTV